MKPFLSVVVPTFRVGGLDILLGGLSRQTFRNFELVLVDCVARHRRQSDWWIDNIGFPMQWVEPVENLFPVAAFCRCANTGLARARGEVAVLVTDYTWLPPDCLQKHADFHRSRSPQDVLLCPHRYLAHPPISSRFPSYGREDIDRYVEDLESGRLTEYGISLCDIPFSGNVESLPEDEAHEVHGSSEKPRDPKLSMPAGGIRPEFFHGKNASVRLEIIRGVGGWNEALDGAHGYQDSELAGRLTAKAGVRWTLDPSNVAIIVNPRHYFPFLQAESRDIQGNHSIWKSLEARGYPIPPSPYASMLKCKLPT